MKIMKAGQKLDSLLAEKVMGWIRKDGCWIKRGKNKPIATIRGWHPSTSLETAMTLMRPLAAHHVMLMLHSPCPSYFRPNRRMVYRAILTDGLDNYWRRDSPNGALAISRAVLEMATSEYTPTVYGSPQSLYRSSRKFDPNWDVPQRKNQQKISAVSQ